MNLSDILDHHALARPDHPAIEDGARLITYGELARLVRERAASLHAVGIRHGDTVALMLPDSADHLITLYALARVGAIIFSLSDSGSRRDVEESLAGVSVDAVIAPRAKISATAIGAESGEGPRPFGKDLLNIAAEDLLRTGAPPVDAPDIGDDAPILLVQSSGTTGTPKTFLCSHAEMAELLRRYAIVQEWSAEDRCLSLNHLSFNIGRNVCMGMLRVGATVIADHANSVEELALFIQEKHVSYVKLTPAHTKVLLNFNSDREPLFPDVRAMVVGSSPLKWEDRQSARRKLTDNFYEQLGANEAGLLVMATPADQDARPEALGRVVQGVEAEIVDDVGTRLAPGEIGQVRYRGAGIASRYIDNPEASARAFRDGWFYPGDLASIDAKGYLYHKGRADDVINNQGAKFYPIELENVLLSHPEVVEAAVLGWPHKVLGQVAAAFVVRNSQSTNDKDLIAYCQDHIAVHKRPAMIIHLSELPKNAMGKVIKNTLRDQLKTKLQNRKLN
ncbi:MAG: class I adenylate-forming enzyme family protein [Proteobacteria bacterium]|nr:class I adenylate-forming enzyme family protein [Pseudomonadota bacterium]MDA1356416.1 class I adenylate-forming enzyme family protein [Pseudomonadota bacterium]